MLIRALKMLLRGLLILPGLLLLAGMTGWSVLAIYFGDSQTTTLQIVIASCFGLLGLVTLIAVFIRSWRRPALAAFTVSFALVLGWWFSIEATNDRNWVTETARLAQATIDGNRVTVHNIRNFQYRTETDFTPAYYDKTFDLNRLDTIDVFAVYWMGPEIAHTIVSFGFGGEDFLAVSIEARKQQGEDYSTIRGFFRQYEQIHIVADEADVIRLRTDYRQNPVEHVYRYQVQGSPQVARSFFLEYLRNINAQHDRPQFYNTLLSNCTNVIWKHARVNPERVPFSWKLLVSGYAPEYLYESGKLDTSVSFAELRDRGYVNPVARKLARDGDFSRQIRAAQLSRP